MELRNFKRITDELIDCEIKLGDEWHPYTLDQSVTSQREVAVTDEGEPIMEAYSPFAEIIESGDYADERPTAEQKAALQAEADRIKLKAEQAAAKLSGFEYGGVMCSVTKEDQWGLSSLESTILGGVDVPFYFENGNVLMLTQVNYADFKAAWMAYRATFFGVEL